MWLPLSHTTPSQEEHIVATATRRRKAAPDPVEEELEELDETTDEDEDDLEELEEPEDDLEELEEEEEPEPEPAPRKRGRPAKNTAPAKATKTAAKKAAPAERQPVGSGNDSAWLASYVNEQHGTSYDARSMRILLRKLANDGVLAREVGTDRQRYDFPKGENDPVVKQVLKLAKSGAIEKARTEGLETAKASRAKKTAAAPAATKAAPAKKARGTTQADPVQRAAKPAPAKRTRARG
jgi:hypothetical protein